MPITKVKLVKIQKISSYLNQSGEQDSFVQLPRGRSNSSWKKNESFADMLNEKLASH